MRGSGTIIIISTGVAILIRGFVMLDTWMKVVRHQSSSVCVCVSFCLGQDASNLCLGLPLFPEEPQHWSNGPTEEGCYHRDTFESKQTRIFFISPSFWLWLMSPSNDSMSWIDGGRRKGWLRGLSEWWLPRWMKEGERLCKRRRMGPPCIRQGLVCICLRLCVCSCVFVCVCLCVCVVLCYVGRMGALRSAPAKGVLPHNCRVTRGSTSNLKDTWENGFRSTSIKT